MGEYSNNVGSFANAAELHVSLAVCRKHLIRSYLSRDFKGSLITRISRVWPFSTRTFLSRSSLFLFLEDIIIPTCLVRSGYSNPSFSCRETPFVHMYRMPSIPPSPSPPLPYSSTAYFSSPSGTAPTSPLLSSHFRLNSLSAYRYAPSHSTVATVFPGPNFSASSYAATTFSAELAPM